MTERNAPTTYELAAFDAALTADIMLRLADLVDGGDNDATRVHRLSETQIQLMSKPATVYSSDPEHLARRLREVSSRIESQLPGHAPAIRH